MSGRYGRGYVLAKLNEAMGQLRYEGLDLSHLALGSYPLRTRPGGLTAELAT